MSFSSINLHFIRLLLSRVDLFEIAWGWDKIYPWDLVHPLAQYKRYLQDYYKHNQSEADTTAVLNGDDRGNDLAALAHSVASCLPRLTIIMFSFYIPSFIF